MDVERAALERLKADAGFLLTSHMLSAHYVLNFCIGNQYDLEWELCRCRAVLQQTTELI
jgi:hypothetical protein